MENVVTKLDQQVGVDSDSSASSQLQDCVHDCLSKGDDRKLGRVTGIGGVFLKAKGDEKALASWYEENLGMQLDKNSSTVILKWSEDKAVDGGITAWKIFPQDTNNFDPSKSDAMINYRVDSLTEIHERLKKNGANIVQGPESYEYGKFLWVLDPEGNKIALWEPNPKN